MLKSILSEQDDLLLAPYLSYDNLPSLLNDCLQVAHSDEEKDILLLSSLTAVSACLPNVHFAHGHLGKVYYPNLQTFIMAGAASGKGIANLSLELIRPITEQTPILLPGDSTYPAFFQSLEEQEGVGYMHETEGSVITDIWKSGAMSYNTALRKAAEHEVLSRNRIASGSVIIPCPRVSCLITGTFDQFRAFVPSVQNGFFSRLTLMVIRSKQGFDKNIFLTTTPGSTIGHAANQLLSLHQQLALRKQPVTFSLTELQAARLGDHFEKEYGALIDTLGENFHPSVVRMAVTTMRIACILTAMRHAGNTLCSDEAWTCSEADFETAVLISSKLLLHAADAYLQIQGNELQAVPGPKNKVQKQTFFHLLPDEFSTQQGQQIADSIGIARCTLHRWIDAFILDGKLTHVSHGKYAKVA